MTDWQTKIRIGYQISNDGLKFTIPDRISFPSLIAHFHLRDSKTIVLSPNASKGSTPCSLKLDMNLPGCRIGLAPYIHGIGKHFGMMPVHYSVEGSNFVLVIPEEGDRKSIRVRRPAPLPAQSLGPRPHIQAIPSAPCEGLTGAKWLERNAAPVVEPARSPMERVCLEGYGSTFLYDIPMERMLELIDQLAPFRVKE